jgi:hypothetical protein
VANFIFGWLYQQKQQYFMRGEKWGKIWPFILKVSHFFSASWPLQITASYKGMAS